MRFKMLKIGSKGVEVRELQKLLGLHADGIFGNETLNAVKAFQKAHNLTVDGVVGKNTLGKLEAKLDGKYSVSLDQKINKLSPKGMSLLANFEALKLKAYLDTAGIPTIGYGTIKYPNGKRVKLGDKITKEQAMEYKLHDLKEFEGTVNSAVSVPLEQHQYDVLVSLAYNIGSGAFKSSTLLKKLNKGDYNGAADAFLSWVNSGGKRTQGLVNRRTKERDIFLNGYKG